MTTPPQTRAETRPAPSVATPAAPVPGFEELGLIAPLLATLAQAGHKRPSLIQAQAIPPLLEGKDVLVGSQTGSGKTAAFVLPMLQKLEEAGPAPGPRALILEPTRELAAQTAAVCRQLGRRLSLKTRVICGGTSREQQVRSVSDGVDIVVATHGRLLDLVMQADLVLEHLNYLVLDEADRLLDEDFSASMTALIPYFPDVPPQTVFCSATLPEPVMDLAKRVTRDPVRVEVAAESFTPKTIRQRAIFVEKDDKPETVARLLKHFEGRSIVFARTKNTVDALSRVLRRHGLRVETLHGDRTQGARNKALDLFRQGRVPVLVTTDIASRGLDIPDVDLVINMDMPETPEAYVHRIGRTARAGRKGVAFSLINIDERTFLRDVEKHIGYKVRIATEESLDR
ncbi:DEAD/DEAH box family ATP-dependent RNA helicase [Gluconobacter kanchanaburiensis NBRC 103587]|uniref:DEAD/DEAH box family ATP-dependent RNA helicase n=2 Tax=Gluconobacter kanchanaburiensis TaxID=563199 RepID=A0A511BAB4_9PROT|nr:DEAD/DEAH box family ATP-dependent RNA helicase [Gluconobacter kanchanaburiensis NBRC 103587]